MQEAHLRRLVNNDLVKVDVAQQVGLMAQRSADKLRRENEGRTWHDCVHGGSNWAEHCRCAAGHVAKLTTLTRRRSFLSVETLVQE